MGGHVGLLGWVGMGVIRLARVWIWGGVLALARLLLDGCTSTPYGETDVEGRRG